MIVHGSEDDKKKNIYIYIYILLKVILSYCIGGGGYYLL